MSAKTAPDKKHSPYLRVLHQRLEDSQEAEAARLFLSDVLVAAIHNEGVGIGGRGGGWGGGVIYTCVCVCRDVSFLRFRGFP